jgi:NmrA-like family
VLQHLAFSTYRLPSTKITLASRTPDKHLDHLPAHHHVAGLVLDVSSLSLSELATTFAPYTTVIGCTGMGCPAGTQLKIARAALEAKVPRYFPWQFGVDYDQLRQGGSWQDLFLEQIEVRDLLRTQERTKWVIVSNGIFADFLVDPSSPFGVVQEDGPDRWVVRALGGWANRVTATKVADIAKAVEALVYEEPDTEGVVFIAGQTVSYEEVADAIEALVSKGQVRRENWSLDSLVKALEADPENGIKKYRTAFAVGTGMSWDQESTWNRRKGVAFAGLREWVQEYTLKKE